MKTYAQWNGSGKHCNDFIDAGEEIDVELYDYFLGCVPPIYAPISAHNGVFCCGEPYTHIDGIPYYHAFQDKGHEYFYLGILTVKQAEKI